MVFLNDIEEILPETIIDNDFFGEKEERKNNRMFSGTKERRHWKRDDLASEHLSHAAKILLERNGLSEVDMILTNVSIPDEPFTGAGAAINKNTMVNAKYVFDLHNTGCVCLVYLVELVETYIKAQKIKTALICISQTAGGRIFAQEETRQMAQAAIPGDGAAVVLVSDSGEHEFLGLSRKIYPESAEDMFGDFKGEKWWEARKNSGCIAFDETKISQVIGRGNRIVPEAIYDACKLSNIKVDQLDYLITNQPNKLFLRNWREAALLPEERHLDTFEKYANLFGAGIPVTLAESMKEGKFKKGDFICLAGFAHAGDFSGATILKW